MIYLFNFNLFSSWCFLAFLLQVKYDLCVHFIFHVFIFYFFFFKTKWNGDCVLYLSYVLWSCAWNFYDGHHKLQIRIFLLYLHYFMSAVENQNISNKLFRIDANFEWVLQPYVLNGQ